MLDVDQVEGGRHAHDVMRRLTPTSAAVDTTAGGAPPKGAPAAIGEELFLVLAGEGTAHDGRRDVLFSRCRLNQCRPAAGKPDAQGCSAQPRPTRCRRRRRGSSADQIEVVALPTHVEASRLGEVRPGGRRQAKRRRSRP